MSNLRQWLSQFIYGVRSSKAKFTILKIFLFARNIITKCRYFTSFKSKFAIIWLLWIYVVDSLLLFNLDLYVIKFVWENKNVILAIFHHDNAPSHSSMIGTKSHYLKPLKAIPAEIYNKWTKHWRTCIITTYDEGYYHLPYGDW